MENTSIEIAGHSHNRNVALQAFDLHSNLIRRNPLLSGTVATLCLFVLYNFYVDGHIVHGLGYLSAMWLCGWITDVWMLMFPSNSPEIPVKDPQKESFYFLFFMFLGVAFLVIRFMIVSDWNHLPGLVKIAILPLLLFIFPIAIAIYLLTKKYSLPQLGFRFDKSILVALPLMAITGITTWLVVPENIHWTEMICDEGWSKFLFDGFIAAALSEEFFRFVGQTRLGALIRNAPWGLFITVCFWALMHTPKWYSDGNGDLLGALSGSARIIPLGLMWSYVIHRTNSILLSILLHGTNLWGLQNP